MKEENINALDELHKGACMGMDATDLILDKVHDKKLKDEIKKEYDNYKSIARKIEDAYKDYDSDSPHKTSIMNKTMTWYGIEMKTINDESNSKIAEILLQGVNMGIIEGKKILNNKNIDKKVNKLCCEYVDMQEKSVEVLKKFL